MPIVNFNTCPDFQGRQEDVVIVGAGAAGLYLASILSRSFRVIVLESGHGAIDPAMQRLNEVEFTGKPMLSAVDGRKRAVGGTTLAWGGQSLPFSPLDFEPRPWVADSGWPINADTLCPHYHNANRAMGIDELDYDEDIFRTLGIPALPFERTRVRFHFSKWAPDPNFRRVFAKEITSSFFVLSNCTCVDIGLEGTRVREVIVSNNVGDRRALPCSRLIIAAGGLETNRTVLWLQAKYGFLSPSQEERLGSGFMEHPSVYAGTVAPSSGYLFQKRFNTQLHGRRKYSLRLSAADAWLRHDRRLNVTAAFVMQTPNGQFDPYTEFRDFSKLWSTRGSALRTTTSFGASAWAMAVDRFVYKLGALPALSLCAEQEPLRTSTLRLADSVDNFGIPRLAVNWDVSPATWHTLVAFADVVRGELDRLRLGTLMLRPELTTHAEPRLDLLYDIGHHMGGTRMGAADSDSVVDTDLRLRGVSNVSICSASVFPTGSHSNPTLTVLALADRLAVHLTSR